MNARTPGRHFTRGLIALLCASFAVPSTALAASHGNSSGGTGLGGGTTTTSPTSTPSAPVSVTSDGVTLQTNSASLLRHGLVFSGTATGAAGKTVEIERKGRATQNRWMATATATVSSTGTFSTTWHTSQVGRFAMRATVVSNLASAASATPALTTFVYRKEKATIYGPGFYGKRTACGQKLTKSTIGVANRNLPCGTNVSILYRGRTLTVPVIDRGPYANGADWDLTSATASALGIDGTEWIGTISLPTSTATTVLPESLGALH